MARLSAPFVLLEDARPGARARLFTELSEVVATRNFEEVRACLERLRGRRAAGFIGYEAGLALAERLAPLRVPPAPDAPPLLWFGLFDREEDVEVATVLPDGAGAWAGAARPLISRAEYGTALAAVKTHIEDGDIERAHLTFAAEVPVQGQPPALYAALRARAGHGAIVFTGTHWILSFSPELLFTLEGGRVTTGPMTGPASANEAADAVHLIESIFPCASIAGAPRLRAMEIAAGLESAPRGVCCGAIGALAANGDAAFGVAVRALVLKAGERTARLGLGSTVAADSEAGSEWRKCLAEGRFAATSRNFDLIETMRFDPQEGIIDLDRHLARLKASAEALDFRCDRHEARNDLQAATFRAGPSRIRLALARSGAIAIELMPLPDPPAEPVRVALAPLPVAPEDFRLRHKTSDRAFYDEARAATGAFEVLFFGPDNFLSEGSFTTLFVERGGKLVTPPLGRGLLPGVLRARLLDSGQAIEGDLRPEDLAGGFFIGNALRGLVRARLRSQGAGEAA